MQFKGYTARVEFDSDAGVFHGEVDGVRDVITFEGTSVKELKQAFHDSVNDYLAMCAEEEQEPDRAYSGRFVVRVEPVLHREMARHAANRGQSLNAFAAEGLKLRVESLQKASETENKSANAVPAVGNPRNQLTQKYAGGAFIINPSWQPNTPSYQTPSITPSGQQAA